MMCAWDALLGILPRWLRQDVDRLGKESLKELRMRQGAPPELVLKGSSRWLDQPCRQEDITFCLQVASRYSPWAAESIKKGFLTAPGGHRIGLCGFALYRNGEITGLREITSICIRVARDFPGVAAQAPQRGSLLIIGAPGWGKTTLLRDLIRQRAHKDAVSVVDERGELFPEGFNAGKRTDVLRGCRKNEGIDLVLRTMSPRCIAVDEITAEADCKGIIRAAGCGVELLATAHADSLEDFLHRDIYKTLAERKIFKNVLVMTPEQYFTVERMMI